MKKESGRSLIEMLGILAVIAVILLASLFMFNNLFKYYQRRETVNEMNTLVTRYKATALSKMKSADIKKLMPGATIDHKKLVTANDGRVGLVANPETSTFVVIGNNLNLSCNDFVTEGNYDSVSFGDTDIVTKEDLAETTFTNVYSHDKAVEALRTICDGKYQYFLYGNASESCDYFVDGKCASCPTKGDVKGKDGLCCSPAELEAKCGYCGTTCGGKGKCVNGVCSECQEDSDCRNNPDHAADKKFYCVNTVCKQCNEVGEKCSGDWPEGYFCNSNYQCVQCDTNFEFWNGFSCECKLEKPTLGEACSEKCGCEGDDLTCSNGFCAKIGSEECLNDVDAKKANRLCKNEAGECVCCAPAQLDNDGKCLDCSKNINGQTHFNAINRTCECLAGYLWNEDLKKCEADAECEQKCSVAIQKGESCSGENTCCCDQGLECKNNTCQCPTIPKVPDAICNTDCGCKEGTGLTCETDSKCHCADPNKPIWNTEQGKCVQCLTTEDCKGNNEYCDTTNNTCKTCSTTPKSWCSISENIKAEDEKPNTKEKGCIIKTPFTCPGKNDSSEKTHCYNNTTCVECTNNLECAENTFCNLETHKCQPCGPDTTNPYVKSIRPKDNAGRCGCPTGYNIYCKSTSAGDKSACVEGNYICRPGCQQTSDCDPNEFCYKAARKDTLGECKPCAEGTYRAEGETDCHGCTGCQEYNPYWKRCVSTCKNDEVCLMKSCTAKASQDGACKITSKNIDMCVEKPKLIEVKGATIGGRFYLPPADSKYLMSQPDAATFCESYGLRLAAIQEACGKDWAYDSGHDCKNISAHNLSQYGNRSGGTFWMDARYGSTCNALTITYSCGNNHEHSVCGEVMYPICTDGSTVKCSKNQECPENYYCTQEGCKPCSEDGTAIRRTNDSSCRCHFGQHQYCGGTGNWKTDCKEGEFICKSECYFNTQCGDNKYCAKEEGKEFGQCSSCPEGQIRGMWDEACHGCKKTKNCPLNQECTIEEGQEVGICTNCPDHHKRDWNDQECKYFRFC